MAAKWIICHVRIESAIKKCPLNSQGCTKMDYGDHLVSSMDKIQWLLPNDNGEASDESKDAVKVPLMV